MDDSQLVADAQSGNLEAFSALMEEHQSKVYNLALHMAGSPEDAADLTQEAFLKAWKGLTSFKGNSSFGTWLYRLTSNVCLDFLRREKRRQSTLGQVSLDDEQAGLENVLPDPSPSPEALLEGKERAAQVRRGLMELSAEHRQVLILREISGLSYGEIARATGLEEGTVKSRIARARLALRNILRSEGNFFDSPSSTKTGRKRGGGGGDRHGL